LDGNGMGGDIVIVEGTARIDATAPSAAENAEYLVKYKLVMDDYGWTPEWFAGRYSVAIRISPTKYRYW
ncbi:MAG: TIGR03667 family PPOX class F420-dependent oxidoreductase, partial [Actinomycetota bacterium]|nr:TIGR03667 family PPOX class F420-dependent oxidoreductase [Actinomycetota bacterium]